MGKTATAVRTRLDRGNHFAPIYQTNCKNLWAQYTATLAEPVRLFEGHSTGLLLATATFQAVANFTDAEGTPSGTIPVGESQVWFAFYDPGANWFTSALWTIISLIGFALSLWWLDRLEQTEKRLARVVIEQPEDLAVPIAQ